MSRLVVSAVFVLLLSKKRHQNMRRGRSPSPADLTPPQRTRGRNRGRIGFAVGLARPTFKIGILTRKEVFCEKLNTSAEWCRIYGIIAYSVRFGT